MKKTIRKNVRLSEDDAAQLAQLCEAHNLTEADFFRKCIRHWSVDPVTAEIPHGFWIRLIDVRDRIHPLAFVYAQTLDLLDGTERRRPLPCAEAHINLSPSPSERSPEDVVERYPEFTDDLFDLPF